MLHSAPFSFPSTTLLPLRQTWSLSMADKATDPWHIKRNNNQYLNYSITTL